MNNVEQVKTFNEIKGNVHEGFYNKDRCKVVQENNGTYTYGIKISAGIEKYSLMNKSNNSVLSLAVISMLTWITYTFNKLPVYLTTHMYDIKVNCFGRGVSWSMYGKIAVKLH